MIISERMAVFLDSFGENKSPFLERLEKECLESAIPIIRPAMQDLLRLLLAMKRPGTILEIGTGVGFSALLMSEYAGEGCRITTIESYGRRIPLARKHIEEAGKLGKPGEPGKITLLEGDAGLILPTLREGWDFIFLDGAKGQYPVLLPEMVRLLNEGGLLVSDNVLREGEIIESRFAVARRNRTIHARMREYLYELTHHPALVTSILPVGDGAAVSVRVGKGFHVPGGENKP